MSETNYYQRNRNVMLNRAKEYYKNDKERLRDNARDKYRNLFEEEKLKNGEYVRDRYPIIRLKKKKQKLKEYQKCYREANKSQIPQFNKKNEWLYL